MHKVHVQFRFSRAVLRRNFGFLDLSKRSIHILGSLLLHVTESRFSSFNGIQLSSIRSSSWNKLSHLVGKCRITSRNSDSYYSKQSFNSCCRITKFKNSEKTFSTKFSTLNDRTFSAFFCTIMQNVIIAVCSNDI